MAESSDPVVEVEEWAAQVYGVGSPQYRWHLAFAAHRCPSCDRSLAHSADRPKFRRCGKCRLAWFAQFSEQDGSARRGSLIACFSDADWGPVDHAS